MPIQTPICDFGQKAHDFKLKSTEGKILSLADVKGEKGTLIMFICNHCPYVKAVTKDIVEDCKKLKDIGINSVAICANDAENYPEDSYENMVKFSKENQFGFPYLVDETQEIAKTYDAVCTPDFFGYNKDLELQYRGRVRELKKLIPVRDGDSDLLKAMMQLLKLIKDLKTKFLVLDVVLSGKLINVSNCDKIIPTRIRWNAKFDVGIIP